MDLESLGVLSDTVDPTGVAAVSMRVLGSLLRSGSSASWATLSSRGTLGFALPDDVAEMLCNANQRNWIRCSSRINLISPIHHIPVIPKFSTNSRDE